MYIMKYFYRTAVFDLGSLPKDESDYETIRYHTRGSPATGKRRL